MPVSPVNDGDPITSAWGDTVSSSIAALEAGQGFAYHPGGTDVAVADGGTGASSAPAAATNLGLGAASVPAFAGVKLPAVGVPSADPNTLDWYEEGTFGPTLAFATPGNSNWTGVSASGSYSRIGNRVFFQFQFTATLAEGNAAGVLQMSGLPYAPSAPVRFTCEFVGYTKAGYTQVTGVIAQGAQQATFHATGSGQTGAPTLSSGDLASGTIIVNGMGHYAV